MFSPEALLFDLDGVLLDTEPLHGKAWKKTAAYFGTLLTNDQLKLLQGRRRRDCANQLAIWINKTTSIENILRIHQPHSKELVSKAKAMPGAKELIGWCSKNKLPISLVTSSASSSVNSKISPHPWLNSFSTRVHGDDPSLIEGKPSPHPYLLGAKKLNVDPKKCWAIEDSLSGAKSAISAGCYVWLLKNNSNKNLKTTHFHDLENNLEYINHLEELINKLNFNIEIL